MLSERYKDLNIMLYKQNVIIVTFIIVIVIINYSTYNLQVLTVNY